MNKRFWESEISADLQSDDDVFRIEDLENKVAVAQAVIDRCIRLNDMHQALSDAGERAVPRQVTLEMIIRELRALREGALK